MGTSDKNNRFANEGHVPRWLVVACLSGCLGLAACQGGNHQDLAQWVKRVKSQQRGHVAPLPEIKPYTTFTYHAKGLRDPFKPYVPEAKRRRLAKANTKLRPNPNRHRQALEAFSLDSLKFVGTLSKGGQTWALIAAPDKTVHRVKIGDYMGQNYGKITRITENKISLREIVSNGMGGWVARKAALTLK